MLIESLIVLSCGAAISYVVISITPALTNLPAVPTRRIQLATVLIGAGYFLLVSITLSVSWVTLKWYVLVAWLVAITLTDLVCHLIPDRLAYSGTLIGIVFAASMPDGIAAAGNQWVLPSLLGLPQGPIAGITLSLLGALVGFLVVEGYRRGMAFFVGRPVMGMGDSKLLMLLGSFLGPFMVLVALVPGVLAGVILGSALTTLSRTPYFPFGPALALGGLVTGLYHRGILELLAWSVRVIRDLGVAGIIAFEVLLLVLVGWLLWRVRIKAARNSESLARAYDDQTHKTELDEHDARPGSRR